MFTMIRKGLQGKELVYKDNNRFTRIRIGLHG